MLSWLQKKAKDIVAQPQQAVQSFIDKRRYPRVSLGDFRAAEVILGDLRGEVLDISYSGLSARFSQPLGKQVNEQVTGQVRFLDLTWNSTMSIKNVRKETIFGFQFQFDPQILAILQSLLQSLSDGVSAVPIKKEMLKEHLQHDNLMVFRGNGPIDIIVKATESGDLDEGQMTFRDGQTYLELRYKQGAIQTARSLDQGLAGRMQADPQLSQTTLRMGLRALIGAYHSHPIPPIKTWVTRGIKDLEAVAGKSS